MKKILAFLALSTVSTVFAATPAKLKLALNWKAEPQFGGFYAAELNGEFRKRGLNVNLQEGGSGTPTVQMLGAQQASFAIVSAEEILLAQERGSKVVALFASFQTNPQAIMTHAERGMKSLQDVFQKDGVLALQRGLSYAQYLLKKYPQSQVQIVPYLGGIANFVKDPKYSQQCFYTSEPLLAEKAGLKVKTFLVSDEGFNPYTTVLATTEEELKKNPETVKAMVEAVRAGWEGYLKSPEATNKHMAGLNKAMDAKTFAQSAALQKPLIETSETKTKGLGTMTEDRWNTLIQQLKDLKLLKKSPKAADVYKNL